MAWETRAHSRGRYYTRTYRENGRRVHAYVGTGERARRIADADAARRTGDAEHRARIMAERARFREADEALRVYYQAVEAQMRATLEAAGYHRHDRGEWRKRRGSTTRRR